MQGESYFSSTIAPRFHKFTHESLSARMFGFMFSKMWVYAVFFNPALAMPLLPEASMPGLGTLSRMALILTFLAGAFTAHGWLRAMAHSPRCYLPAVLSAVGVVAIPLGLTGLVPLTAAAIVAAVGTGVGSGLIALEWGLVYGKTPAPVVAAETALAIGIAAFPVPAFALAPLPLQAVIGCLIPFLSVILLAYVVREDAQKKDAGADAASTPDSPESAPCLSAPEVRRTLAKFCASAVVYGCVVQFLWEASNVHSVVVGGYEGAWLLAISAVCASLITIASLIFSPKLRLAFTYRPVFLLLSLACVVFMAVTPYGLFSQFVARVGYLLFTIISWVILADLSSRSALSPFRIFGIGMAACYVGLMAGTLLNSTLSWWGLELGQVVVMVAGALMMLLVITYTYTFTEHDVFVLGSSKAGRKETSPADDAAPVESAPQALLFDIKCQALAADRGLSERQTEVFLLFAKGRNRKRIEQELYISEGTVNSHLRNIYTKMGVHSRQELLDLLDNFEPAAKK